MSLKNKIILLITASIILSAGLVAAFGNSVIKNSLIQSHYISETQVLSDVSNNIISVIDKISSFSPSDSVYETKKMITDLFLRYHFLEKFSCVVVGKKAGKKTRISATRLRSGISFGVHKSKDARRTQDSRMEILFEKNGRPFFVHRHDNIKFHLDILKLWEDAKTPSPNKSIFIADKKGQLIAHEDASRVLANSDFSTLDIVNDFKRNEKQTKPLISRDERGERVVGIYIPIFAEAAVFSMTPYESVIAPSTMLLKKISFYVSALVVCLVFVAVLFANKITVPLKNLAEAAKKVASGNLEFETPDTVSGDEVGILSENFKFMTDSLKKLQQLRDDLIHMIVHDLKSPLSAIISSIEFMQSRGENLNEKQKNLIGLSYTASKNLLKLIDDLLDVAKLEEGKLKLNKESVDLKNFLETCAKTFVPQAENERKRISLNCPDGITLKADTSLIRRVVMNLLSNAFKHTKAEIGTIGITAEGTPVGCKIKVSDNGRGIPEEYREKIFEKFVQIEGKRSQIRSGVGLGLTFSKMVVEAHGGKISVESRQGEGSSFIFTLPD